MSNKIVRRRAAVLPVIFQLGPLTLYSYGVVMMVALVAVLFVLWKRGRELYFDEETLLDTVFVILLVALVAARAGYVVSKWSVFGGNIGSWLNVIGQPGLMYEVGLAGAMAATIWQAGKRKWNVYSLGDVLACGAGLALAFGALAAFVNGSGYGKPTDLFFGVTFPGLFEPRHPVQLYELLLYSGLFAFLWRLEGRYRTLAWYRGARSEANSGFILAIFGIGHGLIGLATELLREGRLVWGVRWEVIFYATVLAGGVWLLMNRSEYHWLNRRLGRGGAGNMKLRTLKGKRPLKETLGKGIF